MDPPRTAPLFILGDVHRRTRRCVIPATVPPHTRTNIYAIFLLYSIVRYGLARRVRTVHSTYTCLVILGLPDARYINYSRSSVCISPANTAGSESPPTQLHRRRETERTRELKKKLTTLNGDATKWLQLDKDIIFGNDIYIKRPDGRTLLSTHFAVCPRLLIHSSFLSPLFSLISLSLLPLAPHTCTFCRATVEPLLPPFPFPSPLRPPRAQYATGVEHDGGTFQ